MRQFQYCFSYSKEAKQDATIWRYVYADMCDRGGGRRPFKCDRAGSFLEFQRERLVSNFLRDECSLEYDGLFEWFGSTSHPWRDFKIVGEQREKIAEAMGKSS